MPKRTKAVSLARGPALDRVRRGHDDATPERLARARQEGSVGIDGAGVRRLGDPLDALRSRGLLDRADPATNEALWQAGDRLREHWHKGALDSLSALDIARPRVDGGPGPGGTSPSEGALHHREHYRRAVAAIGPRLLPFVAGVALEAQPVGALRALVDDTAHARTAEALALERLREGLHRLCDLWNLRPSGRRGPSRHREAEPVEETSARCRAAARRGMTA